MTPDDAGHGAIGAAAGISVAAAGLLPEPSPGSLDVLVRFHDPDRLAELDRCLFALAMQGYAPLTVHVLCQRFGAADLRRVAETAAPALSLSPGVTLRIHSVQAPGDARAALLNRGVAAAEGRFLAILDYDDVIHPGAYRRLAGELATTGYAAAFGGIASKFVAMTRHAAVTTARRVEYTGSGLAQLFRENFCPIHGVMLDRSKIAPEVLAFDETLAAFEDYDLLLRLCARYCVSFRHLGVIVGDYLFKDDGSNTTPGLGVSPEQAAAWRRARETVHARKAALPVSLDVQRSLGVATPAPGMTVADLAAG